MLTDFFISDLKEVDEIAADFSLTPAHSTNNADNSVLAALWNAIDESAESARLEGEDFLVAMGSDEGPWVFNLPDALTTSLTNLAEAEMPIVADRWANSPALSYQGVSASDMLQPLVDMKRLAETARSAGQRLFLRMAM